MDLSKFATAAPPPPLIPLRAVWPAAARARRSRVRVGSAPTTASHRSREHAEIVRALRAIYYDPLPTLSAVAAAAGINRMALYRTVMTGHVTEAHKTALTLVLQIARKER